MLVKLPRVLVRASVLIGLWVMPVFSGCSQSQSSVPSDLAPDAISFSTGKGQINVETTLVMVPTSVLEKTDIMKDRHLPDAPKIPADPGALLPSQELQSFTIDKGALTSFLAAIRNDQRTLASPRMNLDSGQRASFASTKSRNYVKDFTETAPAPGSNAPSSVTLNVQTLTTGIWIEVSPTISADPKMLAMEIHPTVISFDGIDTFVPHNNPKAATLHQVPNTSGSTTIQGAFVQIPRTRTMTYSTQASVPDGGTLMIIGPRRTEESELVSGTLGGLISNRSYVKTEYTMVTIVRPTIAAHATASAKITPPDSSGAP